MSSMVLELSDDLLSVNIVQLDWAMIRSGTKCLLLQIWELSLIDGSRKVLTLSSNLKRVIDNHGLIILLLIEKYRLCLVKIYQPSLIANGQ